jgi:Tol biopolymer transport system component
MVYMSWNGRICWLSDDAHISWVTWKANADKTISVPGIYKATVTWGTNDDSLSVGTPTKVYDTGTYLMGTDDYRSDGRSPNWSADGTKVLYYNLDTGMVLVDLSGPTPTETTIGYSGEGAISPDGTKIAIAKSSQSLVVMDIDGTNEKTLDAVKTTKYLFRNLMFIHWSPDSTHITYGIPHMKSLDMWCDVYTIGADGSGKTKLTKATTTCDWQVPLEWR